MNFNPGVFDITSRKGSIFLTTFGKKKFQSSRPKSLINTYKLSFLNLNNPKCQSQKTATFKWWVTEIVVLNKNVFSSHRRTNSKRNILNKYLLVWNNARSIVTTTITTTIKISVTHHLNVAVFCDWHFGLFRFRNDNF